MRTRAKRSASAKRQIWKKAHQGLANERAGPKVLLRKALFGPAVLGLQTEIDTAMVTTIDRRKRIFRGLML